MTILLAILQAIILGIMSKVWNAMHPLLGALTGFLAFFVTIIFSMGFTFLLEEAGVELGNLGYWLLTFIFSLALALGFLRLVKRIKEDK